MQINFNINELITGCLNDDKSAWELFVRTYSKLIWSAIHRTFSLYSFRYSREDSEDLYSSVFASLIEEDFRKLRQFRNEDACSFATWLRVVTSRMAIDHIRRDKNNLFVEAGEGGADIIDTIPENSPSVVEALEQKQMNGHFEKAIELLSDDDRDIYHHLFTKDTPPEEIAASLGLTVSTVYSKRHRIIKKIKKSMEEMQENESSNVL